MSGNIVLDGFTLHSASVGGITADEYADLNGYTQKSLTSLIQSLVIHDELIVGKEVIGPAERFPALFSAFSDALIEKPTVPVDGSSGLAKEYSDLKAKFERLGRENDYEVELTQFVEANFFKSEKEPTRSRLREKDGALYRIFDNHSKVRARMYSAEAHTRDCVYVPSPYRRLHFRRKDFRNAIATDILERVVGQVRDMASEELREAPAAESIDFVTPPMMQLVLKESRHQSLFHVASELRSSKEATDFRVLCREYEDSIQKADDLQVRLGLNRQLQEAKTYMLKRLGLVETQKTEVRVSVGIVSAPVRVPDREVKRIRPAFSFLYNIAKANYQPVRT